MELIALSVAKNVLCEYVIPRKFTFRTVDDPVCVMEHVGYFLDFVITVFVLKEVYCTYLPSM